MNGFFRRSNAFRRNPQVQGQPTRVGRRIERVGGAQGLHISPCLLTGFIQSILLFCGLRRGIGRDFGSILRDIEGSREQIDDRVFLVLELPAVPVGFHPFQKNAGDSNLERNLQIFFLGRHRFRFT